MSRLHVNLQVTALDESIRFYHSLFGAEPTVRKHDYAKWMLEEPRVNFSISTTQGEPRIEHLGIQAETPEELGVLRERFRGAGLAVEDEGDTICCYHYSDKTWVSDHHGVAWEIFYTSGEADVDSAAGRAPSCDDDATVAGACCDTDCCGGAEAATA